MEVKIGGRKQTRPFPRHRKGGRVREIAAEQIPGGLVVRGALTRPGAEDGVLHDGELRKDYNKGNGKRRRPVARRLSVGPAGRVQAQGGGDQGHARAAEVRVVRHVGALLPPCRRMCPRAGSASRWSRRTGSTYWYRCRPAAVRRPDRPPGRWP